MSYITVEEALGRPGLRIAFTQGVPGPWSIAARAIFDFKGIDYAAVIQESGGANESLRAWTGQGSAPVAMLDDERPRAHWSELLLLAERIVPEPRLIPTDEDERTLMFGLCHELCGEDGFGWNARQLLFEARRRSGGAVSEVMEWRYGGGSSPDHPGGRLNAILRSLAHRLETQRSAGSGYFVGDRISAADIYWVAFSNVIDSLPHEACPMPDFYRQLPTMLRPALNAPPPAILIEHRDRILTEAFRLPMAF